MSLIGMDDTARLIATVLLASFVIERIIAALSFLTEPKQLPERAKSFYRFLVAAILAAVAVGFANIRILAHLDAAAKVSPWIDYPLSWLVLVGGADRIRDFVGAGGGPAAKKEPPPTVVIKEVGAGESTVVRTIAS